MHQVRDLYPYSFEYVENGLSDFEVRQRSIGKGIQPLLWAERRERGKGREGQGERDRERGERWSLFRRKISL